MIKLVSLLGLAAGAAAASSDPIAPIKASSPHRILSGEDGDGDGDDGGNNNNNNNANMNLAGYSLQYSTCLRTKIASDDDAVEGNSYYVNGAYRAQYNRYATFRLCTDSGNGCTCDDSVEYAVDMDTFLQSSLTNLGGGGGGDETAYLECTYGGAQDGVDYYLGPQCSDEGGLIIGTFYDDECTVKASYSSPSFSYNTFSSIESTCQDCSNGGCDDVAGEAHQCVNGKDIAGDDDEGVCSAVKRTLANVDYSHVKNRHAGAVFFAKVFVTMLIIGLIGGAMFLAYTYYIRHRGGGSEHLVQEVPNGAALT